MEQRYVHNVHMYISRNKIYLFQLESSLQVKSFSCLRGRVQRDSKWKRRKRNFIGVDGNCSALCAYSANSGLYYDDDYDIYLYIYLLHFLLIEYTPNHMPIERDGNDENDDSA